jgi:hypothetical protein
MSDELDAAIRNLSEQIHVKKRRRGKLEEMREIVDEIAEWGADTNVTTQSHRGGKIIHVNAGFDCHPDLSKYRDRFNWDTLMVKAAVDEQYVVEGDWIATLKVEIN